MMTLRAQRWTARVLVMAAVAASWTMLALHGGLEIRDALLICVCGAFVLRLVDRRIMKVALRRLVRAINSGTAAEGRRLYDEYARAAGPGWTGSVAARTTFSTVLLRQRDYASARDVLEKLPFASCSRSDRWELMSNWAHAILESGAPTEAIDIAEKALASAPPWVGADDLSTAKLVLGAAYESAGRYLEAIPLLEFGLAHGRRADQAASAFHLGEAFAALGRIDDARQMYERAQALAPRGRSARRARDRLAELVPYRR